MIENTYELIFPSSLASYGLILIFVGRLIEQALDEKVCKIIDDAIQMHGAAGISQWTPLAGLYTDIRHLRFADGPDEVHHMVVGRAEMQKYDLW